MRVLVTGGTGFIGRASVAALLAAGHEVRVLARDGPRAEDAFRGGGAPGAIDVVVGEPIDRDVVLRALDGRDALVHAAAVYSYDRGDASRVLVETPALARSVLGAALAAGTPHVVDVSSVIVFSVAARRVDESTPLARAGGPAWGDPYLQAKVIAELAGRALESEGLPRVTLHPAIVIGPEDHGPGTSGGLLVALMTQRLFPRSRLAWVDVRDVATAVVNALGARPGANYLLTRGVESLADVARRLDRLTGRGRFRHFMSPLVSSTIARINDRLGGPMANVPTAPSLEYMLRCPPVIDGSRAERELDVTYRDLDETLEAAIRWWVANGMIDRRTAGRLATTTRRGAPVA